MAVAKNHWHYRAAAEAKPRIAFRCLVALVGKEVVWRRKKAHLQMSLHTNAIFRGQTLLSASAAIIVMPRLDLTVTKPRRRHA